METGCILEKSMNKCNFVLWPFSFVTSPRAARRLMKPQSLLRRSNMGMMTIALFTAFVLLGLQYLSSDGYMRTTFSSLIRERSCWSFSQSNASPRQSICQVRHPKGHRLSLPLEPPKPLGHKRCIRIAVLQWFFLGNVLSFHFLQIISLPS